MGDAVRDAGRYAVIQLDRESRDPMELARALAGIHGTPVQDQVLVAKRSWGIIADDLSMEDAKSLQRGLRTTGFASAVGPSSALAVPPAAEPVRTLDQLPSDSPALIAAASILVTTATTSTEAKGPGAARAIAGIALTMSTGVPVGFSSGRKRPAEKTREDQTLAFFADICWEDPPRRIRIDAAHFDFSCLGGRMLYQAQGNLKLLLGDLTAATPEAWVNHGARILLEGRAIREMGYGSLDDLEREESWLLTLRGIRRPDEGA